MRESEWLASESPGAMLEGLEDLAFKDRPDGEQVGTGLSARKLRLFCCACVRLVWDRLEDGRSRDAVAQAEAFADGDVGHGALGAAFNSATRAKHWTQSDDPAAVIDARHLAALAAAETCLKEPRPWAIVNDFLKDDNRRQAALLRDMAGNPWRRLLVTDTWVMNPEAFGFAGVFDRRLLTADVSSLAQAAYDERNADGTLQSDRLCVLADALEEAGLEPESRRTVSQVMRERRGGGACCNNYADSTACDCLALAAPDGLLESLRAPAARYRGFWAVDLVMGKS